MAKFSGREPWRGFGRRTGGTVTVLDARVHRSSARTARVAFILTAVVVALVTATVASDRMHPILALLLGIALGALVGAPVWLLVRIWPVLRVIWWWTPEITLALTAVYGWTALAKATDLFVRLLVVAALAGVFAFRPVRRFVWSWLLCLFVRHRLRVCFAQFIITNRSGSLPFILWARPTPVGERVWVYLRPGLSLTYLQASAEKIAVACSAAHTVIERVAANNAAYLRVDIKRREDLTDTVGSPLVGLVAPTAPSVAGPVDTPHALDLPQVADPNSKPAKSRTDVPAARTAGPVPAPISVLSADGEDVTDWID